MTAEAPRFARTGGTWLTYSFASYIGFYLISLGVVMPYLRDELELSYTVAGLHFSALCLGGISSAFGASAVEHRLSRTGTVWLAVGVMTSGVLLLVTASSLAFSLAAAFLIGLAGTLIDILVQASAADADLHFSASAVSESNASFTLGSLLAPAVIASSAALGFGWRGGLVAWLVPPFLSAAALRHARVHEGGHASRNRRSRLARRTWLFVALCMAIVAAEWTISFWGVTYLRDQVGLGAATAAACMTGFFVAMLGARLLGARLVRAYPAIVLLLASLVLALGSTSVVWLAPVPGIAVGAFLVAGFAVGPLFPLAMSLAVAAAPAAVTRLSARIQGGNNVAILIAPLVLASLADYVGLQVAFGVVPVAVLAAAALALVVRRQEMRHAGRFG